MTKTWSLAVLSLVLTPFLGPLAPVLVYVANGWLLGREFFQMAARRHLPEPQATALRKARTVTVTALGVLIAFALTIPVVNIGVPVFACIHSAVSFLCESSLRKKGVTDDTIFAPRRSLTGTTTTPKGESHE